MAYEHTRVNNRKRGEKRSKAHLMGRCVQRLENGEQEQERGEKLGQKEKGNSIVGEKRSEIACKIYIHI